jgi:hypothetical protein
MAELQVMVRTYGWMFFMCQSHACENAVDPKELRVKGGISLSLSFISDQWPLSDILGTLLTLGSSG